MSRPEVAIFEYDGSAGAEQAWADISGIDVNQRNNRSTGRVSVLRVIVSVRDTGAFPNAGAASAVFQIQRDGTTVERQVGPDFHCSEKLAGDYPNLAQVTNRPLAVDSESLEPNPMSKKLQGRFLFSGSSPSTLRARAYIEWVPA